MWSLQSARKKRHAQLKSLCTDENALRVVDAVSRERRRFVGRRANRFRGQPVVAFCLHEI